MESFKFSPINFDKLNDGHVVIIYHPANDWLADLELVVENPEANRLNVPPPYATHVGKILVVKEGEKLQIPITKGMLFWKSKAIDTLYPGTYIFEETPKGVTHSDFKGKYGTSTCVEIRKSVVPFNDLGIAAMKDSTIKNYQRSFSYGWPAFITQPLHTFLNIDLVKKTILGAEICSALVATIVNDGCRAMGIALHFADEYNTNPLEWQINPNWERDEEVQPRS
jgi:hypothetical protein